MSADEEKVVSVGYASQYLGITIDELRSWDRDKRLCCIKLPSGHRRYRMRDLESFKKLVLAGLD